MTEQASALTQEQETWVKQQYQTAVKYLAEKGIVTEKVAVEQSRYIAPEIAIWQFTSVDSQGYWVISGNLPCDHVHLESAPVAREALRHFALKWQLQG